MEKVYPAIYDFSLFPYALGDALTWNMQTTLRAIELGADAVDVHLCLDAAKPASIFQAGLINQDNFQLHFQELLPAFQTHPMVRHLKIYSDRRSMLSELDSHRQGQDETTGDIHQYEIVMSPEATQQDHAEYFIKFIYSHRKLNEWAGTGREMPLLKAPSGYAGEVRYLFDSVWKSKRVIAVHFRQRRMDIGMGGEHTYDRDASFSEWHAFLRQAAVDHPDVHFVVLGRLQEKPLSILRLPNVTSLRTLGMCLGHELALVALADLFLGSSSGFAAMANFTAVPYFITKMGKSPCDAYEIPLGAERLPFALPNQVLVYEEESAGLLERCLKKALELPARRAPQAPASVMTTTPADGALIEEHQRMELAGANTHRYFMDDLQEEAEVMLLLQKDFDQVLAELDAMRTDGAAARLARLQQAFPRAVARSVRFHALLGLVERSRGELSAAWQNLAWCLLLDREAPKDARSMLNLDLLKMLAQPAHVRNAPAKKRGIKRLIHNIRRIFTGKRRKS